MLVGSYKEIDIIILLSTNDLITYSKNINKENTKNVNTIKKKDITIQDMQNQIQTLEIENEKLRDGRAIKEKDNKILELNNTIKTQKEIIIQKNNIISNLEKTIDKIQKSFEKFKEGIYKFCDKLSKAIAHIKGNHTIEENEIDYDGFELEANEINSEYDKDKEEDFEITM